MGQNAVAVTGEEGREALEAALRIVAAIEQAHAAMAHQTPSAGLRPDGPPRA
jgi:hypothetical protein